MLFPVGANPPSTLPGYYATFPPKHLPPNAAPQVSDGNKGNEGQKKGKANDGKKRTEKRQPNGAMVDNSKGDPTGAVTLEKTTTAGTLPVTTVPSAASNSGTLFSSPTFNVGQPLSPQHIQWRLRIQESFATLQRAQANLQETVTSRQVGSHVSTYVTSLLLVNQRWSESQIEEKLQAERAKHLEIMKKKHKYTRLMSSVADTTAQGQRLLLHRSQATSAVKSDDGPGGSPESASEEQYMEGVDDDPKGSQDVVYEEHETEKATVDVDSQVAEQECEPRPCPEDLWLQGRMFLDHCRISGMIQDISEHPTTSARKFSHTTSIFTPLRCHPLCQPHAGGRAACSQTNVAVDGRKRPFHRSPSAFPRSVYTS